MNTIFKILALSAILFYLGEGFARADELSDMNNTNLIVNEMAHQQALNNLSQKHQQAMSEIDDMMNRNSVSADVSGYGKPRVNVNVNVEIED